MGTLALQVIGASKTYVVSGHESPAFRSVDLGVKEGELFALLGPSGCGKSTLLRSIAGLESLSGGRIEDGHEGAGRRAGIVFQDSLLLPWLTVRENVGLGLTYGANRAARNESVDQLLDDFGLTPVADAYPDELSGGQAQRASLARTIVTRPKVLLLDEPFGSLDPRTRAALQDWLLGITRQRGLTVIIVTHDVDEALYLGDRVALMSPGPGTILRTWENPWTPPGGRDPLQTRRIREEIMSQYVTDVRVESTGSWSI